MHVENQNNWVALGNRIVPQCSLWLPCVYGYWERASLETKLGLASSTKAYLHLCQAVGQLLHILCSFDTQCGIVRYFLRMSSKIMRWMLLNTLLSPKSLQIACFQIASQVSPSDFVSSLQTCRSIVTARERRLKNKIMKTQSNVDKQLQRLGVGLSQQLWLKKQTNKKTIYFIYAANF